MTATRPLVHDFAGAAAILAPVISEGWLRRHVKEIPHHKFGEGRGRGGRVGFTDADIAAILDRFAKTGTPAAAPTGSTRLTRRRAS